MLVKQAANVVELLEYFARRGRPATLSEIADELGWPRSSTFNLLTTLADKGYLFEPRSRGGFYPSPRWNILSQAVSDAEPPPKAAHDVVTEVADETGETTGLCALSGLTAIYLMVAESEAPVRYTVEVGHRMPLQATATGRALLSLRSAEERSRLYRKIKFERYAANTLMTPEAVEEDIRRSRERGWFRSDADYHGDLCGVAAPLAIDDRRYAVVIGGPNSRCLGHLDRLAATLLRRIERHAGGGRPGRGATSRPPKLTS